MTDRDPRRETRDARDETDEAARTGRFPDEDGALRDDSAPVEREIPAEEVDDDTMRFNEAYPLRDDLPGVVVTPPSNQRRDQNLDQSRGPFDPGVDT